MSNNKEGGRHPERRISREEWEALLAFARQINPAIPAHFDGELYISMSREGVMASVAPPAPSDFMEPGGVSQIIGRKDW